MFRIIVNAAPMQNIATGIGRYLASLYNCIAHRYPEIEIKYFDGTGLCDQMPVPPAAKSLWSAAVNIAWHLPPQLPFAARVFMQEKNARRFYKLSRGFDVYHEAGYFPFKPADNVHTVFMIHDISLKTMPECHPAERVMFFNRYFDRSLQYADAVITPSEFTRSELESTFPDLPAPVFPIHLGYERDLFFPRTRPDDRDQMASIPDLPEKYLLFVGTSDPRKNLDLVFKALEQLPDSIVLVCAGWSGWKTKTADAAANIAPSLKHRIIFTGYVSDHTLACLYAGARAFVYPSFYEGFGLPVLEAMACGCPVICAHTASLPEVAGSAAALCDPHDAAGLARLIHDIFSSDEMYETMRANSLARAEKFTWEKTADKTIDVFKSYGKQ